MAFLPTIPGLSFYTIPIAWILSLLPHIYAVKTYEAASSKRFDNTQPRSLTGTVASEQSLSKATKDVRWKTLAMSTHLLVSRAYDLRPF